jgi:hypothetical protein
MIKPLPEVDASSIVQHRTPLLPESLPDSERAVCQFWVLLVRIPAPFCLKLLMLMGCEVNSPLFVYCHTRFHFTYLLTYLLTYCIL